MINLSQVKIEDLIKKSDNIFIVLIVLVSLIFVARVNGKNAVMANSLTQKINTAKKTQNLFRDINIAATDYDDYKKKIFFPKDPNQVINMINEWAGSSNVEITSLRPQYLKESGLFFYVPIDIEAKGDYAGLGKLLSRIENYEGFADIVNLRITPERNSRMGNKALASDKVNISLSFNALFLKDLDISEVILKRR